MDARVAQLLQTTPLFRGVSDADRGRLLAHTRVHDARRGDVIFAEGHAADRLCIVTSGRAKVFKSTTEGHDLILGIVGAGDPIGAVAVYEDRPFPASAVALEAMTYLTVDRTAFFALLEDSPTLVRGLLAGLTRRLVELTTRLSELAGGRVEQRLARFFLKLGAEVGQPGADGVFIPLRLSRQELADLTGTTIETAIRIMSRWGKQRIVRTEATGFVLLKPAALERLVAS
jgi:CRP-like cAMP-binding protein